MRACRLRIADAHPSKVVKALVMPQQQQQQQQPSSEAAAFLLSDGSGVLLSLAAPPRAVVRIPKPCSDACFLRVQTRMPASEGGAAALSEGAERGSKDLGVSPKNKALKESVRVLFLTCSPGRGGSATDIRAWLCEPPFFPSMPVEIDSGSHGRVGASKVFLGSGSGWGVPQSGARLDIPHGAAAMMAASVNVIALYSAFAGKVWLMAARSAPGKIAPNKGNPNFFPDMRDPQRGSEMQDMQGTRGVSEGCGGQDRHFTTVKECLVLIKCSVVDCNGPIYSLALSYQFMLLGERGGVRVWNLRPLVKPTKVHRGSEQLINSVPRNENGTAKILSGEVTLTNCHSSEYNVYKKEISPLLKLAILNEDQSKIVSPEAKFRPFVFNGLYEENDNLNKALAVKKVPYSNSLTADAKNGNIGVREGRDEGDGLEAEEGQLSGHSKWEGEARAEQRDSTSLEFSEDVCVKLVGLGPGDAVPQKFETDLEACNQPRRHLQIPAANAEFCYNNMVVENIDAKRHEETVGHLASPEHFSKASLCFGRNGLLAHRLNVFGVKCKRTQPVKSATCLIDTKKQVKPDRQIRSFFIPFLGGKKDVCSSAWASQVTDIQQSSPRDFLVLNSAGQLHLLTMEKAVIFGDYTTGKEMTEDLKSTVLEMIPLRTSLNIKSFAIVPPTQAGSAGMASISRRIWISDGAHSIHILSFSDRATLGEEERKNPVADVESVFLSPLQALFSDDRVHSLVSLAEDTILALTEKNISTYVIPAT